MIVNNATTLRERVEIDPESSAAYILDVLLLLFERIVMSRKGRKKKFLLSSHGCCFSSPNSDSEVTLVEPLKLVLRSLVSSSAPGLLLSFRIEWKQY